MAGNGHTITVNVEVEPWLHKFLEVELGPSPWKCTMDHYEGKVLFANFTGKYRQPQRWIKRRDKGVYQIIIPWKYIHQWGLVHLPQESIDHFVDYQQRKFTRQLILWVESRITINPELRKQIQIKDAIFSFCEKFGISEDDVAYETLKKRVFRNLMQKKQAEVIIS